MIVRRNCLPICLNKDDKPVHQINTFLRKCFPEFDELYREKDASMRETIFFLIGVVGFLSTEMLTSVFVHIKLASIRTVLFSLCEDGLVFSVKVGDLKKHEDSLVCSLYCLSPKGIRQFKNEYPHTEYVEVYGPSRTTLHAYYASICLMASYMSGLQCRWEYEDYLSSTFRNGYRQREGLLRADAAILAKNSYCLVEVDTGTETLGTLLEKINLYYCHKLRLITNDSRRTRYMICFAVMKPRVSLADEPRYSPAKLRVMKELLSLPYIEERFKAFSELEAVRYDRTGLSNRKTMICREVFKDIRDSSPLDLTGFRLDEFEDYCSRIESQTSEVYQEDRARRHDHLCEARIDNLTDIILGDLFSKKHRGTYIEFLLEGIECFFVPVLRLYSFLPFVFHNEPIPDKTSTLIMERCRVILDRAYEFFSNPKYSYKYMFGSDELDDCATLDHLNLVNAFIVEDDGEKYVFCVENVEYDLAARIRVAFAERFLCPLRNTNVFIICLVKSEQSYNNLKDRLGLRKNKNENVTTVWLEIGNILK